ncbi:MAG: putative toxin-antitoxin system toxin component, PIN family [Clostridiales bacterium]|nr:putative toxin-antitoxin system toxin component, PIN family [Clostridiales bacterium]
MKYYAVIDTNVLVSAMLRWNSLPGSVIQNVFEGIIVPVLNKEIVKEYREVLMRPKFHLPNEIVENFIEALEEKGIYIDASPLEMELVDPKDKIFYEVVMEERKEEDAYLVTGNIKHFPKEPFVVTPREVKEIIQGIK